MMGEILGSFCCGSSDMMIQKVMNEKKEKTYGKMRMRAVEKAKMKKKQSLNHPFWIAYISHTNTYNSFNSLFDLFKLTLSSKPSSPFPSSILIVWFSEMNEMQHTIPFKTHVCCAIYPTQQLALQYPQSLSSSSLNHLMKARSTTCWMCVENTHHTNISR